MDGKLDFDIQSNKYIEIEKHYSLFNYYTIFNEIHTLLNMHSYDSNQSFKNSKFLKLLNTFQVKYNIDDDVKVKIQTFFTMRSLNKEPDYPYINSYLQQFHDVMKNITLDISNTSTANTSTAPNINYEKLNVNEFKDQSEIQESMKYFYDYHFNKFDNNVSLSRSNIDQFTALIKSFYYQLNITDKWTKMLCDDDTNLIIIPCFFNDDTFLDYKSYVRSMGVRIRKYYGPEVMNSYLKDVLKPDFYKTFYNTQPNTSHNENRPPLIGKFKWYYGIKKNKSVKLNTKFNKFMEKNVYFLKCIPNSAMKDEDYEIKLKSEISKLEAFIQKRFLDFLDSRSGTDKTTKPVKKIILFYNDDDTLSTIMYNKNLNSQTIHSQINKFLIKLLSKTDESVDIKTGIQQRRMQSQSIHLNDNIMISQFEKLKQKRVFLDILRDKKDSKNNLYETFFNFYNFIIQQYHDSLIRNDNIKLIEKVNDLVKYFKVKYSTKMINEDLYNIDKIVINKNKKYTLELDDLERFELEGYFQSKRSGQYKFKLNKISNCQPLQDILTIFIKQNTMNVRYKYIKEYVDSLKNRKNVNLKIITEINFINTEVKKSGFSDVNPHKIDLILYLIVNHANISLVVDEYDFSFELYVYNSMKNVIEFVHDGDLRHSRVKNADNQILLLRFLNKQLPMLSNIYYYSNFMLTTHMVKEYLDKSKSNKEDAGMKNQNKAMTKSKESQQQDDTSISNSLLNILSSQEKLHELFVFSSLHKRYNKYIYNDSKDRSEAIIKQIISMCLIKGNSFYMQKSKEDESNSNTDILTNNGFSAYKINNVSNIKVNYNDNEASVKIHLIPSKELKDQEYKPRSCEEKKKRITQKAHNSFGKILKKLTRKYKKGLRKITKDVSK